MVERRWQPGNRIVTGHTIVVEVVLCMIRVRRGAKVARMTRVTVAVGVNISSRMASDTLESRMRARQGERSGGVIES